MKSRSLFRKNNYPLHIGEQMQCFCMHRINSAMKILSCLCRVNSAEQEARELSEFLNTISWNIRKKTWIPTVIMQWFVPKIKMQSLEKKIRTFNQRNKQQESNITYSSAFKQFSKSQEIGKLRKPGQMGPEKIIPIYGEKKREMSGSTDYREPTEVNNKELKERPTAQDTAVPKEMLGLFSQLFGVKMPSVTIHQSFLSDKYLKYCHADAMTVGRDIYIKTDANNGDKKRRLALLGHELTHVVQNEFGRSSSAGIDRVRKEKEALSTEQLILTAPSIPMVINNFSTTRGSSTDANQKMQTSALRSSPTPIPLFAESSRDVQVVPPTATVQSIGGTLSGIDMQRIKDEVYRDLMMRIKIDFERGA